MSLGEFSVVQFFVDGSHEYVERNIDADTAARRFADMTRTVGARIGTTVKVIITDDGDCTNMEWQHGRGITYPPEMAGYVARDDNPDPK